MPPIPIPSAEEIKERKAETLRRFAEENTEPRRNGAISKPLLKAALLSGATFKEAGRLAGSLAQNPQSAVSATLERDPDLRAEIVSSYRSLESRILATLEDRFEDINKIDYDRRVSALGKIADRLRVLEGYGNHAPIQAQQTNITINVEAKEVERAVERITHG